MIHSLDWSHSDSSASTSFSLLIQIMVNLVEACASTSILKSIFIHLRPQEVVALAGTSTAIRKSVLLNTSLVKTNFQRYFGKLIGAVVIASHLHFPIFMAFKNDNNLLAVAQSLSRLNPFGRVRGSKGKLMPDLRNGLAFIAWKITPFRLDDLMAIIGKECLRDLFRDTFDLAERLAFHRPYTNNDPSVIEQLSKGEFRYLKLNYAYIQRMLLAMKGDVDFVLPTLSNDASVTYVEFVKGFIGWNICWNQRRNSVSDRNRLNATHIFKKWLAEDEHLMKLLPAMFDAMDKHRLVADFIQIPLERRYMVPMLVEPMVFLLKDRPHVSSLCPFLLQAMRSTTLRDFDRNICVAKQMYWSVRFKLSK